MWFNIGSIDLILNQKQQQKRTVVARLQPRSVLRNPLNAVFGVDANVVVLRELVRHGGVLAASEIVDRSGASKSSIRLGLLALEQLDLVVVEGTKSTRLHRFNRDHYFGPTIEALFDAEARRYADILDAIRRAVASLPQVVSLSLFGSTAAGKDRIDSDVDILLVTLGADVAVTVQAVRERLRQEAVRLGFTPNVTGLSEDDVDRLKRERDPWWQGVLAHTVLLKGRQPDSLLVEPRRKAGG